MRMTRELFSSLLVSCNSGSPYNSRRVYRTRRGVGKKLPHARGVTASPQDERPRAAAP